MKLYNYWRSSSSYRVRIALHYKQLPFEYVAVNLLDGAQFSDAHRARNPVGSVPVLEVTEGGQTLHIAQSVAIAEYLDDTHRTLPLFPGSPGTRALIRSLAETINSGIQPFHNLSTLKYVRELKIDDKKWAAHWIDQGMESLEKLAARTAGRFMVGDQFSWADACLIPQLYGARRFGGDVNRCATLLRIESHCLALECVAKAQPDAQPDAPASQTPTTQTPTTQTPTTQT